MTIVGQVRPAQGPARDGCLAKSPLEKVTRAVAQKLYDGLVTRPDGTLRPTYVNLCPAPRARRLERRSRAASGQCACGKSVHAARPRAVDNDAVA